MKHLMLVILVASIFLLNASATAHSPEQGKQRVGTTESNSSYTLDKNTDKGHQKEQSADQVSVAPQQISRPAFNDERAYENEQIRIQKTVSYYTKWLVFVGAATGFFQVLILGFTIFIANKNAKSADQSAKAATAQTNLLLRREQPRMVVRSIGFHEGSLRKYPSGVHSVRPDQPLQVDVHIANFGNSSAFDLFYDGASFIGAELPQSRPTLGGPNPGLTGPMLPPIGVTGEKIPTAALFIRIDAISEEQAIRIRNKETFVFIFGYVRCVDLQGLSKETGFAFVLDVAKDPTVGNFDAANKQAPYNYYK